MFVYEIMAMAPARQLTSVASLNAALSAQFVKFKEMSGGQLPDAVMQAFKGAAEQVLAAKSSEILKVAKEEQGSNCYSQRRSSKFVDCIYGEFKKAIAPHITAAQNVEVRYTLNDTLEYIFNEQDGDEYDVEATIQFYTPPAMLHRVATGLHPSNPYVDVRIVGTAMPGRATRLSDKAGFRKTSGF